MIKNYLTTAWRSTLRSITYSTINILGLAAGLSSFIIILLYLNYELSYDKWNPELKKVYKISSQMNADISPQTPAPLAQFLAQKYPKVEAATSVQSDGDFEILLAANNKKIYQKDVVTVDSSFLKVFPYKLVRGNAATALNDPKAAVLSQDVAYKLFGHTDPIGKPIKIYNSIDCVITGVMAEPTGPSHLTAKMLMRDPHGKQNNFWGNYSFQTYIKLKHADVEPNIEDAINRIYYNGHLKKGNKSYEAYKKGPQQTSLFIDAVPNIHNFPKHGASNFTTVSILLVLAVLLLLAGAINFSNLAIAKSMRRAKEVGVRKVLGSNKGQLIFQFMTETALQCIISLILAIMITSVALPYINQSFNITLSFWQQDNTLSLCLQIALCLVLVTLLSGLYPSMFLSHFNTTKVLKGDYSSGKKGTFFRNGLIVVQFMVSVFFIIGTIVISNQMHYMQTKDRGFSGAQVLRVQSTQKTREQGFEDMKARLLTVPGVSYVSKTTKVPGDGIFADTSTIDFKHAGKPYRMASVKISKDYFKTMQIALVAGRQFTDELEDQNTRSAIINESAARKMNLASPIGETIAFPDCDSIPVRIVGVVKDFNVHGFETGIQPEVYTINNKACMFQSGGGILVKLNTDHMQQSVAALEQEWKKIEPDFPIRYSFLDENFQRLFVSYTRLQKIITFFATIAILISTVGLLALTAFFMKQRTKEIGVRKVLGASVSQLTVLLSREFVLLVLLAIIIVSPVAWWFMQKWLQTFVYRIDIGWWVFAVAGSSALFIALVTISFQSIKAALSNPVESLRSE